MISDQDHVNGASDEGSLAPLSQVWQLTNNRKTVLFEMPDMTKFADGSFDIPNSYQADIYELIYGNGTFASVAAQLNYNKQRLRGLYALFGLVCVKPKFVLDDEDRQIGELGPRNVGWIDVMAAYNFFRFGPTRSLSATEDQEPELVTPTATTAETG